MLRPHSLSRRTCSGRTAAFGSSRAFPLCSTAAQTGLFALREAYTFFRQDSFFEDAYGSQVLFPVAAPYLRGALCGSGSLNSSAASPGRSQGSRRTERGAIRRVPARGRPPRLGRGPMAQAAAANTGWPRRPANSPCAMRSAMISRAADLAFSIASTRDSPHRSILSSGMSAIQRPSPSGSSSIVDQS
jgi:hypothetical protein